MQTVLSKLNILIMIVVGVMCALVGSMLGFMFGQNSAPEKIVEVYITPLPTLPQADIISPTPSVAPTMSDEYAGWREYILTQCGIKLMVPPSWLPARRGELGTCGLFRNPEDTAATGIEDYKGSVIAILEYSADSIYSVDTAKHATSAAYLTAIEKATTGDRLIEQKDYTLDGKTYKYAFIDRESLGKSNHIFYTNGGKEFIIIWGGTQTGANAAEIEMIFKSIKFL